MRRVVFIIMVMLTMTNQAMAKSDEVDYLQLATLMLQDGHVERANDALNSVDTNSSELDKARFYLLRGLVYTKKSFYKEANENFRLSIANSEDTNATKPLYLYIAQNSYKLKNYQEAIDALDSVPELTKEKPKLHALKAECYWQLKQYDASLAVLRLMNSLFPTYYDAYKQRFYYYISLALYQSALEDANVYLAHGTPNETIMLNFISSLRKGAQIDKAIILAEEANLLYEQSAKITVLLAHLYIDKEKIQAAAELFNEASIEDGKYINESAEMYRRAHDYTMALLKNTQMLDTKEKYKQRVAIYLEYGDFERIISGRNAMQRSGLLDDENMRYALAYAYYMEGEFNESETVLQTLTKPDLITKALELRTKMQKCRDDIWECQL